MSACSGREVDDQRLITLLMGVRRDLLTTCDDPNAIRLDSSPTDTAAAKTRNASQAIKSAKKPSDRARTDLNSLRFLKYLSMVCIIILLMTSSGGMPTRPKKLHQDPIRQEANIVSRACTTWTKYLNPECGLADGTFCVCLPHTTMRKLFRPGGGSRTQK